MVLSASQDGPLLTCGQRSEHADESTVPLGRVELVPLGDQRAVLVGAAGHRRPHRLHGAAQRVQQHRRPGPAARRQTGRLGRLLVHSRTGAVPQTGQWKRDGEYRHISATVGQRISGCADTDTRRPSTRGKTALARMTLLSCK